MAGQRSDHIAQRRRGQRTGGDNDAVPVVWRRHDFFPADFDQRFGLKRCGDGGGKAITIDCKRAARGQLICVGGMHNERLQPTHLGMQEADGTALRVVRAERVRTNELGQLRGLVDRGRASGAHFVQHDRNTPAR